MRITLLLPILALPILPWPILLWPILPRPSFAAELPVRRVTLSNAGLMQVEREGELAAEAAITLDAPLAAVDDLLKSLLLRDPAGQVQEVRLAAQDLAAEAFRGLPLRPEDFADRASLMRALRGQAVVAGEATGRLLDAEEGEAGLRVTLLTEAGLRLLLLREGEQLRLADPALAAQLARATEALATSRSADMRRLSIRLAGATAPRRVGLTYVTAAPLWKPSWRLVLPEGGTGEARLQGWAVVENHSGADWEGVQLALVSGNPAAFAQPLYTPLQLARPVLPVRGAAPVTVEPDTGPRPAPPAPLAEAMADAKRFERRAAPAAAAAAPVAALAEAMAEASPGRIAFTLPNPVTIRGGETANLPFLDARLPAERLWWVQDLAARHPLNAVRLGNASGHVLPDGLAALYDADGRWLGDAELRAVAPAEQRLLAFASDRDLQLSRAEAGSEQPVRIAFRRNLVEVGLAQREEVALAVDPGGASGRMVIDLPRRPGATPRFPVAAEGDFGLRTESLLEGRPVTLRFAWEREARQEVPLWDPGLGDPGLLPWRGLDLEQGLRRLPGGPGSLESLQAVLQRLPAEAPGRDQLAGLVAALAEARRLLETARGAIRGAVLAEAALDRARAAVEDRSGPAKEEARRQLNAASLAAGRAGSAADAAWEAWQRAAQAVRARTG
ncbi:DUF4139 domain-containing protein [Roseicella frigidaeris]|uniref:DUF4139 domain-containing protein n=1 Tax=Roseicella frigidaeris TaxID=2230885 RepID=A0A327MDP0_9PROT|nr:DUF4139 domain-containing protein [Roseicella frigidaeris]RAI60797.1 hypothetical protein DOO78_01325 [Roseicella frigidaeris]